MIDKKYFCLSCKHFKGTYVLGVWDNHCNKMPLSKEEVFADHGPQGSDCWEKKPFFKKHKVLLKND